MNYFHDMMHCSQNTCKKKDKCYRYWLGKELKNTDYRYASFYYPEEAVTDGCEHFLNIKEW